MVGSGRVEYEERRVSSLPPRFCWRLSPEVRQWRPMASAALKHRRAGRKSDILRDSAGANRSMPIYGGWQGAYFFISACVRAYVEVHINVRRMRV
jgi:hypothetical protein